MVENQRNECRIVEEKDLDIKSLAIDVYDRGYFKLSEAESLAEAQRFLDFGISHGATQVFFNGTRETGFDRTLEKPRTAAWLAEHIEDVINFFGVSRKNLAPNGTLYQEIVMPKSKVAHPEGKICLLDGRLIEGYKTGRYGMLAYIEHELLVDKTFYAFPSGLPYEKRCEYNDMRNADAKLFYENAFMLFDNSEFILNDSRMFLCPVPALAWLKYTGTSCLKHLTLGVYIELWKHCSLSRVKTRNGKDWLVYNIIGSPLTDNNECLMVDRNGKTCYVNVRPFKGLWRKLVEINTRYDGVKDKYDSYSLREVLDLLKVGK